MGLIHWWPLNDDLNDRGVDYSLDLSNNGITSVSTGKIGKCYKVTAANSTTIPVTQLDYSTRSVSFGGWFKFNQAEIAAILTQSITTSSATTPTGQLIGNDSYGGLALVWTSNNIYSSGSFTSMNVFATLRDSNNQNKSTSAQAITFDTWYHFMLVWDLPTLTLSFYVNGVLKNSKVFSQTPVLKNNNFRLNYNAVYGGNGPARSIPMYMNDIRMYDYALSVKEVKELSKGLILHYDFEDPYYERTENLCNKVTPAQYSGWGTITATQLGSNSYRLKNTASNANNLAVWSSWGYDVSQYIGETITFSFTLKNMTFSNANNSTSWIAIGQANNGTYPSHIVSSGTGNYIQYTGITANNKRLTWTGTLQEQGKLLIEIWTNATSAPGYVQVDLEDIQIELKDHATPYVDGVRAIENTTNLIASVTSSNAKLPVAGNGVDITTASGDAYCTLNLNTSLESGKVYTLSFDVSNMGSSDRCQFGFYESNYGNHNSTAIHNGRSIITFTAWANVSSLTFDDGGRSNSNVIHLRNFQLEQRDYATPYTPTTRTGDNTLCDSSGYSNNGIISGNLLISSDSISGERSSVYNGSSVYIESSGPYLNGANAYTISIWCKPTTTSVLGLFSLEYNTNWRASASTSSNKVRLRDETGDSTYKEISMGTYTANEWALYTLTYNNGTAVSYKNGVQVDTVNVGGTALNTNQNWLSFGKNHQNSVWYNGKIGDIKIYATALSSDDVLLEYNRKASIDRKGNLFTGNLIADGKSMELLPGTYIGSDANSVRSGYSAERLTYDDDYSMVFTDKVWTWTQYIPVTAGETLYWDITYSNTSGNQFYVGLEHFDIDGASGSNELCSYQINGDTAARDHYRVKGTHTVRATSTTSGNPIAKIRLRILNAWNGASDTKVAKIHHISLRRTSNPTTSIKIDKNNFVTANSFREDKNYTKTSLYKNGIVGSHGIHEI